MPVEFGADTASTFARTAAVRLWRAEPARELCYHSPAREQRAFVRHDMPNIKQQKKRVLIASRQRSENLRYRSTIKTLTKRLETAVADGDADDDRGRARALVRLIDKAASRGAIHKNTAARKKSQAARLVAVQPVASA